MAATYTPIATTTLGSAQSSYTFSSISSAYTDLILIYNGTVTATGKDVRFYYNGDNSSGLYSFTRC